MAIVVPFMCSCLLLHASKALSEDDNLVPWDDSWYILCTIVSYGMTCFNSILKESMQYCIITKAKKNK